MAEHVVPVGPRRNQKFPYCAETALKMICQVYGLRPGDTMPPPDELLDTARRLAALGWDQVRHDWKRWDTARAALAILDEIGGLFEPEQAAP